MGFHPDGNTSDLKPGDLEALGAGRAAPANDTEETNRRLWLLATASKSFAEVSRDLSAALNVIAQRLVEMVGDTASVALISLLRADGTALENAAARAREPHLCEYLEELSREPAQPIGVGLRGRVAATGEGMFVSKLDAASPLAAELAGAARLLQRFGTMSLMIVPLRVGQRILGTVTMTRAAPAPPFSTTDLTYVEELADRAALTIENARLFEAATRASRVRDRLLFVAGHELLHPLTVLRLQIASLRRQDFDPARAAGKLEMTARSLDRIHKLTEQLIDLSCIAAGQLTLRREAIDLCTLVHEVVATFSEQIQQSGCDVDLYAPDSIVGQWDRARIGQVIANLLANAYKHGGGHPVEIAVGRAGDMVFVQVKDHGTGIPAEQQARIFQGFERAVAERPMGGLRLGLWICREIVEGHGGRLTVDSAPGAGSTFTVYLPSSRAASTAA